MTLDPAFGFVLIAACAAVLVCVVFTVIELLVDELRDTFHYGE